MIKVVVLGWVVFGLLLWGDYFSVGTSMGDHVKGDMLGNAVSLMNIDIVQ